MDVGTLIDAIVRQTTVLVAQLATAGGGRPQLAHTANKVFLDLVDSLKEQGLTSKVIADMFGLALRTYHSKIERLSESRTIRGRSLWEALLEYIESKGPVHRTDVLGLTRRVVAMLLGGTGAFIDLPPCGEVVFRAAVVRGASGVGSTFIGNQCVPRGAEVYARNGTRWVAVGTRLCLIRTEDAVEIDRGNPGYFDAPRSCERMKAQLRTG